MKHVNPYLNFAGNAEEAFEFYRSVFGGEFTQVVRFGDLGDGMGVPEEHLGLIAHISLPLGGGSVLMGTDVLEPWHPPLQVGNNVYIHLDTDGRAEAERLFSLLADAGRTEMELQRTEWAELYGSCIDRFGVQWMVMYTGSMEPVAARG